jgi:hypothetical protein
MDKSFSAFIAIMMRGIARFGTLRARIIAVVINWNLGDIIDFVGIIRTVF